MSQTSPRAWLRLAAARAQHLAVAVRIGDQRRAAAAARLAQVVQARQLAALALPVADRVLDELERRVLAEVADREDRLEHRLQTRVLALARQTVHLQEALVGLLLDLDQVRDRNGRLDFREIDALAVDVLGKAVHSLDLERKRSALTEAGDLGLGLGRHPEPRAPSPEPQVRSVARRASAPSYLTSTLAPTSSNFFLIAAASSFGTPSLIGLGALSTRSFASLRPRLVTSRTTLMTLILLAPISVSVTVNSVFSSTGAAAAAAAAHRHRHRHRRRGRHAELRLERLHELRELEHADSLDVFDHLLLRHFGHCSALLHSSRLRTSGIQALRPKS